MMIIVQLLILPSTSSCALSSQFRYEYSGTTFYCMLILVFCFESVSPKKVTIVSYDSCTYMCYWQQCCFALFSHSPSRPWPSTPSEEVPRVSAISAVWCSLRWWSCCVCLPSVLQPVSTSPDRSNSLISDLQKCHVALAIPWWDTS